MTFVSTRNPSGAAYSLAEALRLGPAPDGGLFMPQCLEPLPETVLAGFVDADLKAVGYEVLRHLLQQDLSPQTIREIAVDALNFEIPLAPVAPNIGVLEIFHGPTLAFKDVGARFLARLLAATRDEENDTASTVLVATSGDTGGAVAQAFHGVSGTRVAILYPAGKVSPVQERQFTTLGGNVRAFAVDGAFDDCQRLVNESFADRDLAESVRLTSANSINVGRLLPQIIYYFHAAAEAKRAGHDKILFCTPSGNFGNLTAGLLAKKLGLEARFVAATNANDVVPIYLETGRYEPRPSLATISNAMDVGRPNNFIRIQHLYDHDVDAIRRDVVGCRFSDEETRATMARIDESFGYVLDPHTAVGWSAVEKALPGLEAGTYGIVLGTAHPAKFGEVVEPALGRTIPLPEGLARHLDKPVRSEPLAPDAADLRRALLSWS